MSGVVELKPKRAGKQKKKKTKRGLISNQIGSREFFETIRSRNEELEDVYAKWSSHLAKRSVPKPLKAIARAEANPLIWGIDSPSELGLAIDCIEKLGQIDQGSGETSAVQQHAKAWLAECASHGRTPEFGLECLAWATNLPRLASEWCAQLWSVAFGGLIDAASSDFGSLADQTPWGPQLILGELPIALGYYFPEFQSCVDLQERGCEFVSRHITELLDGEGLCRAKHLDQLRPLLASWLRCAWMTQDGKSKKLRLAKTARRELDWCIRQTYRLTRADRGHAFQKPGGPPAGSLSDFMASAVRWSGDPQDRALHQLRFTDKDIAARKLPEDPAYHSEWSEIAILQADWEPHSPKLVVAFDRSQVRVELTNAEEIVLSGTWAPHIQADGQALTVASEWTVTCWSSDVDVDFIELEAELNDGWVLQRHFLLARQDGFLWAADVVAGGPASELEYALDLPVATGVSFHAEKETREGTLKSKRNLALLCPPGLPEWRQESRWGDLNATQGGVQLRHQQSGKALYAPLFFDLHKRRMRQPATWRQLTVAESLQIVGPDVAVGYRVQVGPEQWICYRSLAAEGNRTVLGQNYSDEFVMSRFLTDGDAESMLEISSEEES